jgi:hypothetical protein
VPKKMGLVSGFPFLEQNDAHRETRRAFFFKARQK